MGYTLECVQISEIKKICTCCQSNCIGLGEKAVHILSIISLQSSEDSLGVGPALSNTSEHMLCRLNHCVRVPCSQIVV